MMCNNTFDVFVWYREETAEQGGFEGDGRNTVVVISTYPDFISPIS